MKTTSGRISSHGFAATLMLMDIVAIALAGIAPAVLYDGIQFAMLGHLVAVVAGGVLVFLLAAHALSAYRAAHIFEWPQIIPRAVISILLTFFVLMVLGIATKTSDHYSRVWFFSWISLSLALTVVLRAVVLALVEARLARGACLQRALIVSCGDSPLTGDQLSLETKNRVRAIGTISADNLDVMPDLAPYLRQLNPEVVVLSLPWSQAHVAMNKLKALSQHAAEVLILPHSGNGLQQMLRLRHLGGRTLLQVAEPPIAEWDRFAKRVEDVVIASTALFLLAPFLLLVALAIKLDSRGPILFKQKREGFNGSLIDVLKFRSMYVEGTDLHASRQTSKDDPRVTRIGRLIRRSSLDELPQFWNVLTGQMSVVGPRPHALQTSAEGQVLGSIVEEYAARHRVKPGITGWAQVNGARGELNSREQVKRRVDLDLYYIENWSVLFDLKIILMTALRVFHDPHAY
ncbi:exopolysaccharide biosynthesis polyprenyl glycosylphosphotransferase [Microvirga sp. HBU67558]|uniref:exopolysaccharide biosynthesis polyprenyl glycosylphosphotransferase n=1 Tax=Microvirga TaxID=186650 RepID=UPI001B3592FF|nr:MULTISPECIES: exopolysaccharide biosynthesis polyprenyl glycosylphosphotransferase [unclassified Microvirga]MBQ0820526.1 exopolysaccharide biosynthesis polyprenyl glycosylphosphotransferase [Microvirga sp. HBU67558]